MADLAQNENVRITLVERTKLFNEQCRVQRIKLHPSSENLSEMVRDIVYKLEVNFDNLSQRVKSSPSTGTMWKSQALEATIRELPRIPIAGTESGVISGFGKYIYQPQGSFDNKKTVGLEKTIMKFNF